MNPINIIRFSWKETHEYKDIAQFYHDVETSCYQVFEEKHQLGHID